MLGPLCNQTVNLETDAKPLNKYASQTTARTEITQT